MNGKYNIQTFQGRVAVHCPTLDIWNQVRKVANLNAPDGTRERLASSDYNSYGKQSCISPGVLGKRHDWCMMGDKDFYLKEGYSVIDADEYLRDNGVLLSTSTKEFPTFVKMGNGSCLRLTHVLNHGVNAKKATYFRDGGHWEVNAKWLTDPITFKPKLVTFSNFGHNNMNDIELTECTESEWRKCNGSYAPKFKPGEEDSDEDEDDMFSFDDMDADDDMEFEDEKEYTFEEIAREYNDTELLKKGKTTYLADIETDGIITIKRVEESMSVLEEWQNKWK